MNPDKETDLRLLSARGNRVKIFFDSDFWTKDLKPYLALKEKEISLKNSDTAATVIRTQNSGICEKIALLTALQTGELVFIKTLLGELQSWIDLGEESSEKMEEFYAKKSV